MRKARNFYWAGDEKFKDLWKGEKGLIIGRGPNLNYEPDPQLKKFKGKVIGCNTAFNARELDACVYMDEKVFFNNKKKYKELVDRGMFLFGVNPIYPLYDVEVWGIEARKPKKCSKSFDEGFYPCRLTGFIALNIALLMGLNPIYLYGFDPVNAVNKDKVVERSFDFKYISDWCNENNRKVYITNKSSLLGMFFEYKPFIRPSKRSSKTTK